MTYSTPPLPPETITDRLRDMNARLGAHLQVQAIRRTHAEEREDLRNATAELRRWREGCHGR